MMMKEEKTAVLLLLLVIAVLSVTTVFLESAGHEVFASQYTAESPEGAWVVHRGAVEAISTTRTGGHQILTVSGVKVFVPAASVPDVHPGIGENVSVCGEVQVYQGEREIFLGSVEDLRIVRNE
ncbi:MAG: hypothetical protein LUQ12_01860 [Methanoregulaceae archaeon]|nr:hypothetical protein [Methanoregulaceae archaeon]